jgi:hypothetical protein
MQVLFCAVKSRFQRPVNCGSGFGILIEDSDTNGMLGGAWVIKIHDFF